MNRWVIDVFEHGEDDQSVKTQFLINVKKKVRSIKLILLTTGSYYRPLVVVV